MAWWAMIPAALQAGGTLLGADANARAAKIEAMQLRQQANSQIASASRAASEALRQSELAQSRARAVAGNQGGGVTTADVVNSVSELAAPGEYNAMSAIYEGRTAAQSSRYAAKMRRWEAKRATTESLLGAGAQLGQGYVDMRYPKSMYEKYGGGGRGATTAVEMYRSGAGYN